MKRLAICALVMMVTAPAQAADAPLTRTAATSAKTAFDTAMAAGRTAVMSDPHAGIADAYAAAAAAKAMPPGTEATLDRANADWLRAWALLSLNQPDQAFRTADGAIATVHRLAPGSKQEGDLVRARGIASAMAGHVQTALVDLQEAFRIFQRANDVHGQATTLQDIGAIYIDAGDYPHVLRYFSQAADLGVHDATIAMAAQNNIAFALIRMNKPAEAVRHYRLALAAAQSLHVPLHIMRVLTNLASAEIKVGDLAAADQAIARARALAAQDRSAAAWMPYVWGVSAQAAQRRGDYQAAKRDLTETFKNVDLKKTDVTWRDFHQTAFEVYRKLGDDHAALAQLEAFERLDNEARQLAVSTNSALMSARFDFANQDLKITKLRAGELQRDVELDRARGRLHRIIAATVGGAGSVILALLLFALISTRRSRNEIRGINDELSGSNQALEKALRAKTEFLATTSHEIRTPLNGILGMAQVILADGSVGGRLRERVEVVQSAGQTMRALVDDILDVAKMESGHLTITPAEMSLEAVLAEARKLWGGEAERKGLRLAVTGAPALDRLISDEQRLRQIIFNLLSNALKFTDTGSVELLVSAEGDGADEWLIVTVRDTGIGIAPERHEEIFESFKQVDGGTTRKYGGTGLGLTISRNLATAMGGTLTVDSREGAGAVFTLRMPLTRADAPPAAERQGMPPLADARILLIEANPLTQSLMRALVGSACGHLEAAASVAAAADHLRSARADIVLTDLVTLGGPQGAADNLAGLAAAQPQGAVVVLVAGLNDETRAMLLAAGARLVIAKPIAGPALLTALRGLSDAGGSSAPELVQFRPTEAA